MESEKDKRDFVLAFRDIIRKHAEIQIYDDYNADTDDLGMTEQQFMDFRSKYLDILDMFPLQSDGKSVAPDGERLDDIDFSVW